LESDFSSALGLLLSYECPDDPSVLVQRAIEIKKKLLVNSFVYLDSGEEDMQTALDDFFDFENIEEAKRESTPKQALYKKKQEVDT
jgi:hypothetical protein